MAMLLALVLTGIRFGFPLLGQYPDKLADYLSRQVGVPIHIDSLTTRWRGPFPYVELSGIEALAIADTGPEARFRFESISAELNPWESFLTGAPIFQTVDARGLFVRWYQRDGKWLHPPGDNSQSEPLDLGALAVLAKLLLVQPEFRVLDSQLELVPEYGPIRLINLSELLLENTAEQHQLSGAFRMPLLGNDTQLGFVAQLEGEVERPSSLGVPFYFKLQQLGTELFDLAELELPLSDLDANAEVWGKLSQQGLEYLRGSASIERASIAVEQTAIELINSSTEFGIRPFSEGFQISFRDTQLGDALGQVELANTLVELHKVAGDIELSRVVLEQIDLGTVTELLDRYTLPDAVTQAVTHLSPAGLVKDLVVDFNDQQRGPHIRATLSELNLAPWRGAPGVKNLSADIEADRRGGRVDIDAQDLSLSFPQAYSEELVFALAQGAVRWRIDPQGVRVDSGVIELLSSELSANGRFGLDLPFDTEQQAYLDIQVGIQGANVSAAATLTPERILGDALTGWLERALKSGRVDEAGLILQTGLRALESRAKPVVELFLASSGVNLDYQAPWPELSEAQAFIHLHDGALSVNLETGRVADNVLGRSWAFKASANDPLHIIANIEGELHTVDKLFRSEPLATRLGSILSDWQLAGEHKSLIQLDIALDASVAPRVQVSADVKRGIFASAAQRIALTAINGQVKFDTDAGLSGSQISADFLGRSAKVDISTAPAKGVEVRFSGRWPVLPLFDWSRIPLKRSISGEIPLTGRLQLCSKSECVSSLQLESNLVGTAVKGPEVLTLTAEQDGRLSVNIQLSSPATIAVNYQNILHLAMQVGESLKAHLSLGGRGARLPQTTGVFVDGRLSEIDLTEVFALISQLQSEFSVAADAKKEIDLPLNLSLSTDVLTLGSSYFESVTAALGRFDKGWQLELSGKDLDGLISWGAEQPVYRVALNKMHLHSVETQPLSINDTEPVPTDSAIVNSIPSVDFDIADLRFNQSKLGRWRGSLRRTDTNIVVNSLTGELQDLELNGSASWTLSSQELSRVNLAYKGKDLGNTLESLNQTRSIETGMYQGRIALVWDAAPWQFAGKRMNGNLSFNTDNGRLVEASGGSGLLRLLGILNFNTLVRRLQLDFTDLFSKGVVFDSLSGDFLIQGGVARSVAPLVMKGPSAGMEATGAIDLGNKTLDMRVNVSLPLVSNTPLAAVLLGAPQIAGALFLIDKLIGDRIEKATAIAYTLSGAWDSPELNLVNNKTN